MTTYSLTSDTLDNTISLGDHRDFQSRHIHSETIGAYSLDYHTPPSHHYPLYRNYSAEYVPSSQNDFWYCNDMLFLPIEHTTPQPTTLFPLSLVSLTGALVLNMMRIR